MNRQHTTLFIADTSIGFDSLGLAKTQKRYPRLIGSALARQLNTQQDIEILARTLIRICDLSAAGLQIDVLREASDFLISLPVHNGLKAIGKHYQAHVLYRTGKLKTARIIFEELVSDLQFPRKAAAIVMAAGCYLDSGDITTAEALYFEANRAAIRQSRMDMMAMLAARRMIGRIQSIQGDHRNALKSLENLDPLVKLVAKCHPAVYYDHLNSLAVRQIALGHFHEAETLCEVFLSTPFAPNFPNWSETRDELREAREAIVATVFVKVKQRPQQHPEIEKPPIQTSEFDAAPTVKRPIDPLAETESILESQLFFDRAAEETSLKYSCVESEIKPVQSISLLLKPHSDIQFVSYLSSSITSAPKEKGPAADQSVTAAEVRPLFAPTDVVPDNRRPRAPPTIFKYRQQNVR